MMILLLAIVICGRVAQTAEAAEGMSLKSGNVNVLLDNDQVRIVRAKRYPDTKVPMHTHPPYLAYFFGPWKGRFTSSEGNVTDKAFLAGKLIWCPKGKTHAIEVIGTTDQEVLVIELKK